MFLFYTSWKQQKPNFFRCFQNVFNGNICHKWVNAILAKVVCEFPILFQIEEKTEQNRLRTQTVYAV